MATPEQVEQLRRLTGREPNDAVYTGEVLATYVDTAGEDLTVAARMVWTEIAADAANLVDVTESGSSRRLSQLVDNAIKMRNHFGGGDEETGGGMSFTVGAERV